MTGKNTKAEKVLAMVRKLLADPDNDFACSGWEDEIEALEEYDELVNLALVDGDTVARKILKAYFAPTGPIQEVAIASDWQDEYRNFARQVDRFL